MRPPMIALLLSMIVLPALAAPANASGPGNPCDDFPLLPVQAGLLSPPAAVEYYHGKFPAGGALVLVAPASAIQLIVYDEARKGWELKCGMPTCVEETDGPTAPVATCEIPMGEDAWVEVRYLDGHGAYTLVAAGGIGDPNGLV